MELKGRIVRAISGFYYVETQGRVIECRARGIMRKNGVTPLVGDTVSLVGEGGSGTVEEVLDRRNFLIRPPVANIDRLYIVSSRFNPAPNTLLIDRQICICERAGIEPAVVFNKSDEGDFDELKQVYSEAGFETFVISCLTGEGVDAVKASLPQGISVFTGNSGVGKSSLLNMISPDLGIKTGEVSDKLGRGRHTTRHTELYDVGCGRFIADTPGFSTLESDPVPKEELADLFREFGDCLGGCRFTSCSHTCEKGCAVIDAVNAGRIARSRFESYCTLYSEAAKVKSWELKK